MHYRVILDIELYLRYCQWVDGRWIHLDNQALHGGFRDVFAFKFDVPYQWIIDVAFERLTNELRHIEL